MKLYVDEDLGPSFHIRAWTEDCIEEPFEVPEELFKQYSTAEDEFEHQLRALVAIANEQHAARKGVTSR